MPRPVKVDLAQPTDEELAKLQLHANDWYRPHCRVGCSRSGPRPARTWRSAHRVLREILATHPDVRRKLRAIWTLHATGGLDEKARMALLGDHLPQVRAWGVRLTRGRWGSLDGADEPAREDGGRLARDGQGSEGDESSGAAQPGLGAPASPGRAGDGRWPRPWPSMSRPRHLANTRSCSGTAWSRCVARDRGRAASLLERCPSLLICRFIARRLVAADAGGGLAALMPALQARPQSFPAFHREVLDGILDSVEGRKQVGMPEGWAVAFAWLTGRGDADVKAKAAALGLLFGDPKAEAGLRSLVEDRTGSTAARQFALQNLVERRNAGLAPVLFRLLNDPELRASAIRGLAAYNDPATPDSILGRYSSLTPLERDDAIATLSSRPAWALALLDAVRKGTVPRRDVNTTVARQILAFQVPNLNSALEQAWGTLRPTSRDKTRLIAKYKSVLAATDLPRSRPGAWPCLVRPHLCPVPSPVRSRGRYRPESHRIRSGQSRLHPRERAGPQRDRGPGLHAHHGRDEGRPSRLRHPPRADARRPGDPDALRADHGAARRRRGDQGLDDIHHAGGPARPAHASGDPRPVRLPVVRCSRCNGRKPREPQTLRRAGSHRPGPARILLFDSGLHGTAGPYFTSPGGGGTG